MKASVLNWWLGASSTPHSAFTDVWGWWRADSFSGTSPTVTLVDKSANGRNMVQQAGTMTPGTAANGQAKFAGTATTYLNNAGQLPGWPITVITFEKRASGATFGFFGHQGATPQNTLWCGFQTTDRYSVNNASANLTTFVNLGDVCAVTRIGYGSRVSILNGIIAAEQTLASIVNPSPTAVSLGTQFRGLNGDWYETLVWNRTLTLSELDEVFTYGNTRYGMSIPLFGSLTKVKVLTLEGQSNADGRGDRGTSDVNIPVQYQGSQTGVHYLNTANGISTFQLKNITTEATSGFFGLDTMIGKDYVTRTGNEIWMVKAAYGGTPQSAPGTGNGFWESRDNSLIHSNILRRYMDDVSQWWSAMRQWQQAGLFPDLRMSIFYQGETDATDQTMSLAWGSKGLTCIQDMNADRGITPAKQIIVKISSNITAATYDYIPNVQAGEQTAAASLGAVFHSVDDLVPLRSDLLHLDYNGIITLGQRLSPLIP